MALLNVFNSEEYIWYVLKSIYDYVDRLVVIDGSFTENMPSKYSTDTTPTIVQGFPDLENKLIYCNRCSKSQIKQRDTVFNFVDGMDWLIIVDDDEVYKEKDMIYLRKFLENAKDDVYRIRAYNFVNSFDWFYPTANTRLWRIIPGMKFKGPNTIIPYVEKGYPVVPRVVRYHYSYVRDVGRLEIKKKQIKEYQSDKLPWKADGEFVSRDGWNRKRFKGSHPKILDGHLYRSRKWEPK